MPIHDSPRKVDFESRIDSKNRELSRLKNVMRAKICGWTFKFKHNKKYLTFLEAPASLSEKATPSESF